VLATVQHTGALLSCKDLLSQLTRHTSYDRQHIHEHNTIYRITLVATYFYSHPSKTLWHSHGHLPYVMHEGNVCAFLDNGGVDIKIHHVSTEDDAEFRIFTSEHHGSTVQTP